MFDTQEERRRFEEFWEGEVQGCRRAVNDVFDDPKFAERLIDRFTKIAVKVSVEEREFLFKLWDLLNDLAVLHGEAKLGGN
jgi:hypothetical protein